MEILENEINFRPAVPSDAESLFQVKIAAFGEEFRRFGYSDHEPYREAVADCHPDRAKDDGMFSRKWHEGFCSGYLGGDWSLVILADSRIIGQVCAFPGDFAPLNFPAQYPGYDLSGKANVLFCVYVLPEYQDRGIGQMAMRKMEALHPADKWILDTPRVSPKNGHFYAKCGYAQGTGAATGLNVYAKGFPAPAAP